MMQQLSPAFMAMENLQVNYDSFIFIYGYFLLSLVLWLLLYCLFVIRGNTGM